MSEKLLSVGLDVGTTTTQLIVSELTVENQASSFAVPLMQITGRHIRYRSPVHFTPLTGESQVNGEALRKIVEKEYENAGIDRGMVDTGAIIITGETSRKENARTVLTALSSFAGDFVVATAGPDLESRLAAKGAGATEYARKNGVAVLHMDIGGGTSNLALVQDGKILRTGCLNVGGRLLKFNASGVLVYVSPVLQGLTTLQAGQKPEPAQVEAVVQILTCALEMAAGLRPATQLLETLTTQEAVKPWQPPEMPVVLSFSGGVADCIQQHHPALAFGDMGPALGRAIKNSRLCQNAYVLGQETIRATVIGAGSHSTQLSGSTVFFKNVCLPVKNLPVATFTPEELTPDTIRQKMQEKDAEQVVLALQGETAPTYESVKTLAKTVAEGTGGKGVYMCLEADMAKALGHSLSLYLPPEIPILCIDRVQLQQECFLDIGAPVGPALPVVVKTLILSQ